MVSIIQKILLFSDHILVLASNSQSTFFGHNSENYGSEYVWIKCCFVQLKTCF